LCFPDFFEKKIVEMMATKNNRRTNSMTSPEPWLCGPLEGFSRLTMPAAHALLQSRADIEAHAAELTVEQIGREPGGAPSVGFHLRHITGSIDRLLTYAAGRSLTEEQFHYLRAAEHIPSEPPTEAQSLIAAAQSKIDEALNAIRAMPDELLFEARPVGREQLPTNVFGLLFHIAEHTQRHTGAIIATAKIVRAE
jgi:uncharacterized damage-inducible protein DinB